MDFSVQVLDCGVACLTSYPSIWFGGLVLAGFVSSQGRAKSKTEYRERVFWEGGDSAPI